MICYFCFIRSKRAIFPAKSAVKDEEFQIPKKLNRIKEVLDEQERSMQWLVRKTGMSHQTIHDYCYNIRQPNLIRLTIIATVLGVKASSLVVDH